MSDVDFIPPSLEYDPSCWDEIERLEEATPFGDSNVSLLARREHRSPFNGYSRSLTPEGGILICYKDQAMGLVWTILRVAVWILAVLPSAVLVWRYGPRDPANAVLSLGLIITLLTYLVRLPIKMAHSVEIRTDALIIDGEDVFYAEDINDNWPTIENVGKEDPRRLGLCGICGTRYVEYVSVNRVDENDRTADVLGQDLKAAMEQLWGRREVTFPAAQAF